MKSIRLFDTEKIWNDYNGKFSAGVAMAIEIEDYSVLNIHGLWQGSIKKDTEAKLEQSQKILDLAQKTKCKKIVIGDFNLLPDTKSIQMLADTYENLIQKYGIKTTRSVLYLKELRDSDYAFTDKQITVNDFSVPNIEVSDHLPLVVDFK